MLRVLPCVVGVLGAKLKAQLDSVWPRAGPTLRSDPRNEYDSHSRKRVEEEKVRAVDTKKRSGFSCRTFPLVVSSLGRVTSGVYTWLRAGVAWAVARWTLPRLAVAQVPRV